MNFHEDQAYNDYARYEEGEHGTRLETKFKVDRLYYHMLVTYKDILQETEKSVLLDLMNDVKLWVPKKICREWNYDRKTVQVHCSTLRKIIATHEAKANN
jgi:hypothetical protein